MVKNDNPRTKQFFGGFRGGGQLNWFAGGAPGKGFTLGAKKPALGSVSMSFFRNGVIIALPITIITENKLLTRFLLFVVYILNLCLFCLNNTLVKHRGKQ